jgi:hypothetical protein
MIAGIHIYSPLFSALPFYRTYFLTLALIKFDLPLLTKIDLQNFRQVCRDALQGAPKRGVARLHKRRATP